MNKRSLKVALVDIPVIPNVITLSFGYLQAYACKDKSIEETYDFTPFHFHINSRIGDIVPALLEARADVYAYSC